MAISNLGSIVNQNVLNPGARQTLGLGLAGLGNASMSSLPSKLPKINIPTNAGGAGFFGKVGNMFGANKLSGAQGMGISMAGSLVNKLGNSLISDGLSTGVGNGIANIGNTIGGIVGNFNPVLGGIISAGTGIIGGVVNRGWGYDVANADAMKSNTSRLGGISVGDDLASMTSATSNLGLQGTGRIRNGWFTNKGDRVASDLMRNQIAAQAGALSKVSNAGLNLDRLTDNTTLATYSALGGYLGGYPGALQLMQHDDNIEAINNRTNAMYGRKINSGLHAFGGELGTNGADFTNGLLYVDAGGTHESNPYQGVQMGVDENGTPNLVEQGETVYDDYVFSNRMEVPEVAYKQLGLGGSLKKGITFADASKKIAKESEERPNDPISKAGLEEGLARLAMIQEAERQRQQAEEQINQFALGGEKGNLYPGPGNKPNVFKLSEKKSFGRRMFGDGPVTDALEFAGDFIQDPINTIKKAKRDSRYDKWQKGELNEPGLTTPGRFGGGDFGSGAGGRFNLYPDYSDRTTFNEAFDAAYEDALSQGIRPEDYIFMYGEKPYKAEKTNNPLREVDNRLVGNSNRRSKLKREDNYQHMTMGIPGSGLQFAQGGLMGNLFAGTGEWPNNLPREGLYYQIYRLGNSIFGNNTPDSVTAGRAGNYYRDNIDQLRADSAAVPVVPGVFGGGSWSGGGAGGTFIPQETRWGLSEQMTPMLLGNPAVRARNNSILYPLLTNPEVQAQGTRNYLRNTLGTKNDPFTNWANEQLQKAQENSAQDVISTNSNPGNQATVQQQPAIVTTTNNNNLTKQAASSANAKEPNKRGKKQKVVYTDGLNSDVVVLGNTPKQERTVSTSNTTIDSGGRNQRTIPITSKKKVDGKPVINDPSAYKSAQIPEDALWVPKESNSTTPTSKTGGKTRSKTPATGKNTNSTPTTPTQTGTPTTTAPEDPYRRYRLDTTPGNESKDAVLKNAMWRLENQNLPGLAASIPSHIDTKEKIESPVSPTVGFDTESREYPTWMRYIPALGAGIGVATDALGLTNRPDYTYADKIEAAAESAGYTPNVQFTPIGNYMRYNPMDITYGLNQLAAQSRATDRGIQNTAGTRGAAIAGMLANGYNSQLAQGNMYRQALEYNDALQKQVEDFNRGTNQFNAQMGLEAAIANARYQQVARNARLSGLAQAAAMRDAIDQRVSAARSANLTNLFNSLGNIGRENFIFNQIESSKAANNGYSIRNNGVVDHGLGGIIRKRNKRGGAR